MTAPNTSGGAGEQAGERVTSPPALHFNGSAAALQRDHLRNHLTDGCWHDDCGYCSRRRVHGGTGIEQPTHPGTPNMTAATGRTPDEHAGGLL